MIDADELFLTETFDAPPEYDLQDLESGEIRLPVASRRPIDPGFPLTWREYPKGGAPYERTGMVLSCAPPAKSVWVQPADPRPGEGAAVVVMNVTSDDCAQAERHVGGARDFLSTDGWQRPATLPRAFVRVDRATEGRFTVRNLHSDPACTSPPVFVFGAGVVRGRARRVPTCYVFRGRYLHPASVRPLYGRRRRAPDLCGACLRRMPNIRNI